MNIEIVSDIPRLYTAVAEWAACMVYALILKKRFKGIVFIAFATISFGLFCVVQTIAGTLPLYLWIPGMITATILIYGTILFLTKVKPIEAAFWAARAFVLAEFAAALEWQLYYYFVQHILNNTGVFVEVVFFVVVYATVFSTAFLLERRYISSNKTQDITGKDLFAALGIVILIFTMSNLSYVSENTPFSGRYASEIFYIRTLVDLCGLILLYAQQEQRLSLHAKLELGAMQNIMSRHYEQYCLSKENIELLNRKYHDLKHQIALIMAEDNPAKKAEYLSEMEIAIKTYEAQNKTGNSALDTILTGKSLQCVDKNINFTCVADGALLGFMDVMDLCSIIGNALDNAIESVVQLQDPDKRIVKFAVYSQNDLIMMRFENYFESKVKLENGIPQTTKGGRTNHGYGLKSIKAAADKYGGVMKIDTADNWFSLCILIPKAS